MTNPTVIISPEGEGPFGKNSNSSETPSSGEGPGTIISDGVSSSTKNSDPVQRKIVGFLVSYSKTHVGESWQLFLGRNVLGKNHDAEIVLREKRVSENSAILNVRRAFNPNTQADELLYVISDNGATNGVKVNGIDIFFSSEGSNHLRLKASDTIEIGGYKLLLITIDTKALDLEVNPEFLALDDEILDDFDYDKRDPAATRIRE